LVFDKREFAIQSLLFWSFLILFLQLNSNLRLIIYQLLLALIILSESF